MNFYKTTKWLAKRKLVLRRDEYRCRECKRYGRSVEAKQVHHIIPVSWCLILNKRLLLDCNNLISLCNSCHDAMHDRTNDKLTLKGKALLKRFFKQDGMEIIKRFNDNPPT